MAHKGNPQHHFLFKYTPLRLKNPIDQPTNNMSTPGIPLQLIPPGPRVIVPNKTVSDTENSRAVLSSSLDNIVNWCGKQDRQNREIQNQLNAAMADIDRLRAQLLDSHNEVEHLRNQNQQLLDAHRLIDAEMQDIDRLCGDVKAAVNDTASTFEEIAKNKEEWISNFEELKRKHYDKRARLLQEEFQRSIEEKSAQLESALKETERLLQLLGDVGSDRDHLNLKLKDAMSELSRIIEEKNLLQRERDTFAGEFAELKTSFDEKLRVNTEKMAQELGQVKISNQSLVQEIDSLNRKIATTQEDFKKTLSDLQELKRENLDNPREQLQAEISALKSKIQDLNALNETREKELGCVRDKVASVNQLLATHEELKFSHESLSKERTILQDRYTALEDRYNAAVEAIAKSSKDNERLEQLVEELKEQLRREAEEKPSSEKQIQDLLNEVKNCKDALEEKSANLEELSKRMVASEEHKRQLQTLMEEKQHLFEEAQGGLDALRKLKSESDKELVELRRQLMGNAIELEYKQKRLEELEKTLNENVKQAGGGCSAGCKSSKAELNKLKTSFNLKSLELENVNEQLREALETASSAEKEIAKLNAKILELEQNMSVADASQSVASIGSPKECGSEEEDRLFKAPSPFIGNQKLQEDLSTKNAEASKTLSEKRDSFALLQKANNMASSIEKKRSSANAHLLNKSLDSSNSKSKHSSKRRRHSTKDDLSLILKEKDMVSASPVLRNLSGIRTSRYHNPNSQIIPMAYMESPGHTSSEEL